MSRGLTAALVNRAINDGDLVRARDLLNEAIERESLDAAVTDAVEFLRARGMRCTVITRGEDR